MNQWHEKSAGLFYADETGRVLGRVRKGLDTHYAESSNRELGEFVSVESAKAAVEEFFSPVSYAQAANPFVPSYK